MPIRISEWLSQALCRVLPSAAQASAITSLLHALQPILLEVWPFPTSQTPLGSSPLACASPLPGDASSFHGTPPRSLRIPWEKLTTPAPLLPRKPCVCLHAVHSSSAGGRFLGVYLLQTRSSRKASSVNFVPLLTSRKPGSTWVSSQYVMTRCKDHTPTGETSKAPVFRDHL